MTAKAKVVVAGWMAVALLPWFAGPAGAQIQPDRQMEMEQSEQVTPTEPIREFQPKLKKANELIGAKVINDRGERLGTIEEIVLTPDRRSVDYAVLSYDGFWGFAAKLFAVPWSEFEVKPDERVLVLSQVSKADLDKAEGFDRKNWPDKAQANWLGFERMPSGAAEPREGENDTGMAAESRIDRYESSRAAAAQTALSGDVRAGIKHRRLSRLVGTTVRNFEGEKLGELEDIVIDVHEGSVAYAVLSMRSGFLGMSKELAAVPWSALDVVSELGTARLDTDRQTLDAIAFKAKEFPDLEDPQYSRELHQRFNATPYWEVLGFVPGEGEERGMPSPWQEGSEYVSLYNPDAVETIHGTVESVGTFRLEGTDIEGLRLRIQTEGGETVTVHAGPRLYLEHQDMHFHYGDEVTVTGSEAMWDGHGVILAAQIKMGDKTIDLRTREGKPRWNIDELKSSGAMESSSECESCRWSS